ncbi:hypothetical protein WG66_011410, partial [Moniliophthora roreri]
AASVGGLSGDGQEEEATRSHDLRGKSRYATNCRHSITKLAGIHTNLTVPVFDYSASSRFILSLVNITS